MYSSRQTRSTPRNRFSTAAGAGVRLPPDGVGEAFRVGEAFSKRSDEPTRRRCTDRFALRQPPVSSPQSPLQTDQRVRQLYQERNGLQMFPSLGFETMYAILILRAEGQRKLHTPAGLASTLLQWLRRAFCLRTTWGPVRCQSG